MYNAIVGIRPADITSWADFKKICRQLRDPKAHEIYETIVIDTIAIAYSLCEKYILAQQGVSQISEIGYGKGWNMLKDEFESTFRDLTQQGYALVFIAHSKTRTTEYTDEDGNPIEAYAPAISNGLIPQLSPPIESAVLYVSFSVNVVIPIFFKYSIDFFGVNSIITFTIGIF